MGIGDLEEEERGKRKEEEEERGKKREKERGGKHVERGGKRRKSYNCEVRMEVGREGKREMVSHV